MEISNQALTLGLSDNFHNVSKIGEDSAIFKEQRKDLNNIDFMNYIRNNYPQNLYGKIKQDFFDEIIEPDLIQEFEGKERAFFFNLDKLYEALNSMFYKTIEKNPFLFDSIKKDLIKYSGEYQELPFKEKQKNIAENILESSYYLFKSQQYDIDLQNKKKAKILAFLISQLKQIIISRYKCIISIPTLSKDFEDEPFKAYDFPILKEIYNEIEKMKSSSNEQRVNLLYEKTKSLLHKIMNDENNSDEVIIILIMYLINYANKKLLLLENLIYNMPNDILNKIYNLRKFINTYIINYNFKTQTNQKYFFDIEFSRFKIIRDTLMEKEIFLEKGKNLNDFLDRLINDFNYNISLLFSIDENNKEEREQNLSFINKYLKNIEKQENLKEQIEKKIDELKKQKTKNMINIGKTGFKLIFDFTRPRRGLFEFFGKKPNQNILNAENELLENACISKQNIAIDDREISKLEKLIKNIEVNKELIIKIIKQYDLKTQIENIIKNKNNNTIGIIINQKINNNEGIFGDKFIVKTFNYLNYI